MANVRQVKLVCGSESQNLQTSPYKLEAGTWASAGTVLEFAVLVTATSLPLLDSYVADLERWANRAALYDQQLLGDAVEVQTKTCDDLPYTAELGATWTKKRVKGMTLSLPDASEFAAGQYVLRVGVSCEVEELWRRAAPECVLEVAAATDVEIRTSGALRISATKALTARRILWTASSGISVRVFWSKTSNACTFVSITGTTTTATWDGTKFNIQDNTAVTPVTASTASYAATADGTIMDVTFAWDAGDASMSIFVNGVRAAYTSSGCSIALADTVTLCTPTAAAQDVYSVQIWAVALNNTQGTGLYAWGRPEQELCYCVPPGDTKNTSSLYKLYNAPGDAAAALRIVLDGAAQDYLKVRAGLRPLRIPATVAWECESGTLGTNTAGVADANASGGNVARFTPGGSTYATRVTLAICANPANVAALQGEHRLLLACKDSAATVNVNTVKWRLVIAGQNEAYSDDFGVAAVATYSLLDLGTVRIPPGQWPAESISAATDVVGGTYIALELAVMNASGIGGGTFDMDALYLVPAELEGTLEGTFDVSAWYEVLDFSGERPSFVGVADYRSMEFGAWADYVGDRLELAPRAGEGGALMVFWLRDASEQWQAGDLCDVFLYIEPRWRR